MDSLAELRALVAFANRYGWLLDDTTDRLTPRRPVPADWAEEPQEDPANDARSNVMR